jgi:Peptidase family C25
MKKIQLIVVVLVSVLFNLNVSAQKKQSSKISAAKLPVESVQLEKFESFSDGNGVLVRWNTTYEINNLGFNVYRVNESGKTVITPSLIAGSALIVGDKREMNGGNDYSWFDSNGTLSDSYYIEAFNTSGETKSYGPIYSRQTPDLSEFVGSNSTLLANQTGNENAVSITNSAVKQKGIVTRSSSDVFTNQTTQFWVASQPGAKIGVKKEGFYRVLRADLLAAGFNVNAPIANWQLYADGVEQPIIVEPSGNYIEFYGRGVDTLATDLHNYFLVVGTSNGRRIQNSFRRGIRDYVVARNFRNQVTRSDNTTFANAILNGEADNFFGSSFNDGGLNLTIPITELDPTEGKVVFSVRVQGLTNTPHVVKVLLNGTEIATLTGNNADSMSQELSFSSSLLINGNNVVRLVSAASSDYSMSDTIKIDYPRRYVAAQNALRCNVRNYVQTRIQGFSGANVRVFDVSDLGNLSVLGNVNVIPENGTFTAVIPSNRAREFFAVENSGLLSPESITANAPSTWSSTTRSANFLIITHANFMTQANAWADYRRAQGMTVEVINVEDVYDEFDFGTVGAPALKSFFQYAFQNRTVAPGYVMLMGDAVFDGRNFIGTNLVNYVPAALVDTTYSQVGSDEAMVDFNDDGLAEIAIGRIPVKDTATATLIYNKTVSFETTRTAALSRGFICASDLPNGYDFEGVCSRVGAELPASVPKVFVNRASTTARDTLLANLNSGKFLVNYSGHGNTSAWATTAFFSSTDIPALTNVNQLSIYTLLTCLNGYYNSVYSDGLAKAAVKANGAAVASWASSGLTTADVQEVMAARFYQQVGAGNMNKMGDAVKDAKATLTYGRDVRLSWALLGDPTLRIR